MTTYRTNMQPWRLLLLRSLPLMLIAVFLTACSGNFDQIASWKGQETSPAVASLVPDATPEANVPDAPPDLVRCVKQPLCTEMRDEEPRTADQIALGCAESDAKRRICSRQLLKFYEGVKAANTKKKPEPAKPAAKPAPLKKTAALAAPKLPPLSADAGAFKPLSP